MALFEKMVGFKDKSEKDIVVRLIRKDAGTTIRLLVKD